MIVSAVGQVPAGLYSTEEMTTQILPVLADAGTFRTLLRLVAQAGPGDLLDIDARARVTNDTGYTIGVGWHLWLYDVDDVDPPRQWLRIGPSCGDNVDPQRHHMPLHITAVHRLPASWPAGHRPAVVLRGDAHSSAAEVGDTLRVDPLGVLTVRRWAVPDVTPAELA